MELGGLFAQAADPGTNWPELLIAALGASVVGGVLGGTLTTWLRGRIEREEAWQTRIIAAADDFSGASSNALLLGGDCLTMFSDPDRHMWKPASDDVSEDGHVELEKVRAANRQARVVLQRVKLLYGAQSDVSRSAVDCVQGLRAMLLALEGRDLPEEVRDLFTEPRDKATRLEVASQLFDVASDRNFAFTDEAHSEIRGNARSRKFYRSKRT